MLTEPDKKDIAENYIKALANRDAALMASITTEDIVWSIAGTSLVSGEARGVDAILKRSETLNRFGVSIKIEHVVYGLDDVALQHRNTGKHDGKVLDEHITTVCHPARKEDPPPRHVPLRFRAERCSRSLRKRRAWNCVCDWYLEFGTRPA